MGMTYVITSKCVSTCDTACVDVCPVDCIHGLVDVAALAKRSGAERQNAVLNVQLYINPDECIGCGACVPECPVDAIFDEDEVPAEYEHSIAENEAYFR